MNEIEIANRNDKQRWRERDEQRRYEKRVRWQEIRVTQFGYVNYLILTLASGALVTGISPLTDDSGFDRALLFSSIYQCALFVLTFSVLVGIICAYSRLCDFRDTAKTTKLLHERGGHDTGKCIEKFRDKTDCLGEISWALLKWQIRLLCLAIILCMIFFILNLNKLSSYP